MQYPLNFFSKPGRNSAETIKILKDPMSVFKFGKASPKPKKYLLNSKTKINLDKILNLSPSKDKSVKTITARPTSSFRSQSREDWYRYKNKEDSPDSFKYTPNYSIVEKHIPYPKYRQATPTKLKTKKKKNKIFQYRNSLKSSRL